MSGARRIIFLLPVLLAFSVSAGLAQGTTRLEQDDPSITYSGNWYSNESPVHSRGVAALTNAPGARATLTFTGTGITWLGVKDGWAGLATVHLDSAMTIVNSYRDPSASQTAVFSARGLSSGTHTLTIEVTHERAQGTNGSWVWIDAFEIENGAGVPGGVTADTGRVEQNHPALRFTGRWYPGTNPALSGGTAVLATDGGSRATINFNGTGVSWMAYRDEWSGIARVYLDGELKTTIDTYLSPAQARAVPYTIGGLAFGTHALTIEATGTRNESSKGAWIWLDAFDVAP
jgi:hypothetical protein